MYEVFDACFFRLLKRKGFSLGAMGGRFQHSAEFFPVYENVEMSSTSTSRESAPFASPSVAHAEAEV